MKIKVTDKSFAYVSEDCEFYEKPNGKEVIRLIFDACMHDETEEEYDQLFCANQECNVFVRVVEHAEDDFDYSDELREYNNDRGH